MEDNNAKALANFGIIFLAGWIGSINLRNFFHMPNDPQLIGRTAVITFLIACLWLFFLRNEIDLWSIIFSTALMAAVGATIVGWLENFINGQMSFEVFSSEIINKYWVCFAMIAAATILGTKSGRRFLLKTLIFLAKLANWGNLD